MTNITVKVGSKQGFKTNVFSNQKRTVQTSVSNTNSVSVSIPGDNNVKVSSATKSSVFVNQSGFVERRVADLLDVNMSAAMDGAILIYNQQTQMFVASTVLDKQQINGGNF